MKIILASGSPRRAELLAVSGYPFRVRVASIDEENIQEQVLTELSDLPGSAQQLELVRRLSAAKAHAVYAELSASHFADHSDLFVEGAQHKSVILAADTIVCLDDAILGKPHSPAEAEKMLRQLAGRTHLVHTGVALLLLSASGELLATENIVETTEVSFLPLNTALECRLQTYVSSGVPLDKAGAYGIQDYGALFVSGIKGDYYNVMGLPLAKVTALLDRWQSVEEGEAAADTCSN